MRLSAAIVVIIVLLSGCGTVGKQKFHVAVDSINGSNVTKKSYLLVPGDKDVKMESLQFQEYASYVHRALAKQGFSPAESFEVADIAIFLLYGIGDRQKHQYTYSTPTWGQTGVSSSYTTGTLNTYGSSYGTYSGTTTHTATYGVTGSTTHIGSYDTYFRHFQLNAIDLNEYRKTKKQVDLWITSVTSEGSSSDLRQVFPVMLAASTPYIGKNTGKTIKISLEETDKRVTEIKGISKE